MRALLSSLLALVSAVPALAQGPGPRHHPGDPAASLVPAATPAAPVRLTRLALSTGVTLQVAEAGDPDGQPVLFLHGYTDTWVSWSLVADRLPAGIRAIMVDQRGHGGSDRPACCYAMADLEADAVATLDALGIARATVVGHSMGSFVAQRMAASRPGRVSRLVLVGSGPSSRVAPLVEVEAAVLALADSVPLAFIREFQVSTIHGSVPPGFVDRVVAESALMPLHAWKAAITGLVADSAPKGARILAPTLIIAGTADLIFPPADAEALRGIVPESFLRMYPGTGHAVHWEHPDRFVADLLAFIRP